MASVGGVIFLNHLIWDSMRPRPIPTPQVPIGLSSLSARECGACHQDIYSEWLESRMGNSMQNAAFLMDWKAKGELPYCLSCHAPLEAQQPEILHGVVWPLPMVLSRDPNPLFDPDLRSEGVTCVVCHVRDGAVVTAKQVHAPHPTHVGALGEVCARCHQMPTSPLHPLRRPLIDTWGEHANWKDKTGQSEDCVACHMPRTERNGGAGHSHRFPGGWDPVVVNASVALSVPTYEGDHWVVELTNLTGHRFPTGETTVSAELRFVGLDEKGQPLATETTPIGRHVMGPPFIDIDDSSLLEGETRAFRAQFSNDPQRRIRTVRVEVWKLRYFFEPELRKTIAPQDAEALVATAESKP